MPLCYSTVAYYRASHLIFLILTFIFCERKMIRIFSSCRAFWALRNITYASGWHGIWQIEKLTTSVPLGEIKHLERIVVFPRLNFLLCHNQNIFCVRIEHWKQAYKEEDPRRKHFMKTLWEVVHIQIYMCYMKWRKKNPSVPDIKKLNKSKLNL